MGDYFLQITSTENLAKAWETVVRKNSAGGLDGQRPADLSESEIQKLLSGLQVELRTGSYVPVPYGRTAMPKFNEEKEWRQLSLPSIRDKVAQAAFTSVLGPVCEKTFTNCSYAYRPRKGAVKAVRRVEHILRTRKAQWAVPMDIDNFFDNLDREILLARLATIVDETEIHNLVAVWLKAGTITRRGHWIKAADGIAQGSVVSPLLSNVYLNALDQFAIEKEFDYVRYSDNLMVLTNTQEEAYQAFSHIEGYLSSELDLRLNQRPSNFHSLEQGFSFLGIYFKGEHRTIVKGKCEKVTRKLDWLTEARGQKTPEACLRQLNKSIDGTRRHYAFIKPVEQFSAFDRHLLKRLPRLLQHFRRRGQISECREMETFLVQLQCYDETSKVEWQTSLKKLVTEVFAESQAPRPNRTVENKQQSGQARRQTAKQSKFLRQVADQSEVHVASPGVFLGKTGGRLIVRQQRKNMAECALHKVRNISVSSNGVSLSSDLLQACVKERIPITFYSFSGNAYAVLQSPMHALGAVAMQQIKLCETPDALELAKKILHGKSKNQMGLIKYYLRSRRRSDPEYVERSGVNLEKMEGEIERMQLIVADEGYPILRDRLMTTEARISQSYWDCVKLLPEPQLCFGKREQRGATDLVNNMLNYGYGILYQRVWNALLKVGLNPQISFLHSFQGSKPTLVYDMVEEFRQPFVDRSVFSLLTKGKKGADLSLDAESGLLNKDTRNKVVQVVLARLAGLTNFRDRQVKCEDIIEIQARNLVSHLSAKRSYRPYIARF